MRPVFARTSSAASGLRFCGMIDDPVVKRSDNSASPASGDVQITISSAKRDRCMDGDGGGGKRLQHEIAIRDGVERIRHRALEAERLGGHVAVDREGGAGQRGGAERTFVEAPARIREAAAVARRHLHIGQEMMPESHRLRGLQMGEARHHRRGIRQRLLGQRPLVAGQRRVERVDRVPDPQAEIGRHLVVARARGVQAAGRRPDQLGQPALHVHMDVLERPLEAERAGLDL